LTWVSPPPLREAIEFYKHHHNWTNRLISGDSLLVMNSLLEKEGLGGQVQTIYIDPPYGVRYQSNFQPFVNRREVRDGRDEDLTSEPEQIRAFRDTWELGIHSYLTYLRDRLLLSRELLNESGSCFVQIGDENVHRVASVMDEIFGAENRIATITYATTSGSSASTLPEVADYLLWYAKDRKLVKYRQLYEPLSRKEVIDFFNWGAMIEFPDGSTRKPTSEESFDPTMHLPKDARIFQRRPLDSQGVSWTGRSEPYEYNGRVFHCGQNRHWSISKEGLDQLGELGRLYALEGQSLSWKRFEDEVPGRRINNIWAVQMSTKEKCYVVQTANKPIQRCILMTSDPGDLIFDPTCGSGTTAYVAEQWGRRWITCDTSRVAITLAKQRLMTANYDYYKLAYPKEGVGAGFSHQTVPKVSPSSLGYNEPPNDTIIYDKPLVERSLARVTGPFTVESVPAPTVKPIDEIDEQEVPPADSSVARTGPTVRQSEWRDELLKAGIRGKSGQHIAFSRLEPIPALRWLHADGETQQEISDDGVAVEQEIFNHRERVVVSFGPDHAPLEKRQVELAIQEAQTLVPRPKLVVFAAFQFDPEASKDIEKIQCHDFKLLKAQINADLLTEDLKRKCASNESFWLVGQPDVEVKKIKNGDEKGKFCITVKGFDYYNTRTGNIDSGDTKKIAVWMLDPDYDGRSLFPHQVFFPMSGKTEGWAKLARNLKSEIDVNLIEAYRGTESLPFKAGEYNRAAVKIVDDRGVESLKIIELL